MSHHDHHHHGHLHDHGHAHQDLHTHPHTHTHAHPHSHVHSHEHEHVHAHPHVHEGEHCHDHGYDGHAHEHGHVHSHEQEHPYAAATGTVDGTEMDDIPGKLEKLLVHWLKHNADHTENYKLWSQRARNAGMEELADRIDEIASLTRSINDKIADAQQRFFRKE